MNRHAQADSVAKNTAPRATTIMLIQRVFIVAKLQCTKNADACSLPASRAGEFLPSAGKPRFFVRGFALPWNHVNPSALTLQLFLAARDRNGRKMQRLQKAADQDDGLGCLADRP